MNPKERQKIPVISDTEISDVQALEYARMCVKQFMGVGLTVAHPLPFDSAERRVASRALFELERIIDQKKAFMDEQLKADSKAGVR